MLKTIKTEFKQIVREAHYNSSRKTEKDIENEIVEKSQQWVIDNMPESEKDKMLNAIKTKFKQIVHDNLSTAFLAEANDDYHTSIIRKQIMIKQLKQCVIDNMPESIKLDSVAKNESTKKPAKRTKKPVDPAAPKKPKTAYQTFCQNHRDEIKQELQANSGDTKISMIDVTRELGARWKKLPEENPEEYQEYLKTAEEAKAQYTKKLEEYENSNEYKAFIESDELKAWEARNNAIPYVHKVKKEDEIKSAYALFQNEYMQEFVREYQEEIGIPAAKKAFSDLWKKFNNRYERAYDITDDNKFDIDKTALYYIRQYESIKAARTSNNDNNSDADDEEEDVLTGCSHVMTRGRNKGKYCNKTCLEDSDKCKSHKRD